MEQQADVVEQYLDEHRDVLDEIFERLRETVRDFTGGGLGEVQGAFAHLAGSLVLTFAGFATFRLLAG